MFDFTNLKKFFTLQADPQEEQIKCVEFNDYPVFEIDGEKYYVELEDSQLTEDVERCLKNIKANKNRPEFVIDEKRTYFVPSLNKYLNLVISVACELVDDEYYTITHLGIENAVLTNVAREMAEPENVEELR